MALLHGPDADHDPSADAQHAGQLPERARAPLHRGDVVDHGDGQHGVQALVAERKVQVITVEDLKVIFNEV